jgi:hypothetical protein
MNYKRETFTSSFDGTGANLLQSSIHVAWHHSGATYTVLLEPPAVQMRGSPSVVALFFRRLLGFGWEQAVRLNGDSKILKWRDGDIRNTYLDVQWRVAREVEASHTSFSRTPNHQAKTATASHNTAIVLKIYSFFLKFGVGCDPSDPPFSSAPVF